MKKEYREIIDKIIAGVENLPAGAVWESQWDNIPCDRKKSLIEENLNAERIFNDYYTRERITIIHKAQDKAFYCPSDDFILLPSREQFKSTCGYYSVKAHETIHSTGDYTRCYREGFDEYKSVNKSKYSREELTAEIGACLLLYELKIDYSVAMRSACIYIKHYRDLLSKSNKWIYDAGELAEQAIDYILERD